MPENINIGICKLCHSSGKLLESHYIPRAAYKVIKDINQSSPIVVNEEVAIQLDNQMADYLLCPACEDRFNKYGECWVMKNCFRSDGDFKLKRLIQDQGAIGDGGKLQFYSAATIPEIHTEKLAYFAASIIWRGAVHQWRLKRTPVTTLEIGSKYKEELRLYLLDRAPFPTNAIVLVGVITSENLSATFTPAYGEKDREKQYWKYYFTLLGISFTFLLGNRLDWETRQMCTHRSPEKWIYSGATVDDNLIRDLSPLMKISRPVGALTQER